MSETNLARGWSYVRGLFGALAYVKNMDCEHERLEPFGKSGVSCPDCDRVWFITLTDGKPRHKSTHGQILDGEKR